MFGPAGGGGVVLQEHRQVEAGGDLGLDVAVAPGVHLGLGGADGVHPGPELEGHGDAHAAHAGALDRGQRRQRAGQRVGHEGQHRVGRRPGPGAAVRGAHAPHHVDQHQFGRPAPELQPQKVGAVGGQRQRHRGLPDPAAHRFAAPDQAVGLHRAGDDADGLGRQAGDARHVGLRQRPVLAQQAQDQPFVVRPHARLVGAAQVGLVARGRGLGRREGGFGGGGGGFGRDHGPMTPLRRMTLA